MPSLKLRICHRKISNIWYQIVYRLLKSDNIASVMSSRDAWVWYSSEFDGLAWWFTEQFSKIRWKGIQETKRIGFLINCLSILHGWLERMWKKRDALSSLHNHHRMNLLKKKKVDNKKHAQNVHRWCNVINGWQHLVRLNWIIFTLRILFLSAIET